MADADSSKPRTACPINKLPFELLAGIFVAAVYSSSFQDSEVFLSSVTCVNSRWKDLVMSLPSLWSRIDVFDYEMSPSASSHKTSGSPSALNRIIRHLQRSQDHDLDILINRDSISSYDLFPRLMQQITPHFERAVRLEIRVNYRLQLWDVFPLVGSHHRPTPFPRLQSLHLVGAASRMPVPQVFAEPARFANRLIELKIHGFYITEILDLPCHNVKDLDIVGIITTPSSWDRFAQLIQRCNQNDGGVINTLKLGIKYQHDDGNIILPFPFQQPRCHVSSLTSSGFTFCWLIDVAALEELSLTHTSNDYHILDHHTLSHAIESLHDSFQVQSLWSQVELYPLAAFFAKDTIKTLRLNEYNEAPAILFILINARVPTRFEQSEFLSTENNLTTANQRLVFPRLKKLYIPWPIILSPSTPGKSALISQYVVDLLAQRQELSVFCPASDVAGAKNADRIFVSKDLYAL